MADPSAHHVSRDLDAEMLLVRKQFAAMAARRRNQVQLALDAFWTGSREKTAEVEASDSAVDADEKSIDALALLILALRQPVASDLRTLTALLKLVTDLESIGDEAVDISKAPCTSADAEPIRSRLRQMADASQKMFDSAVSSFVQEDAKAAEDVLRVNGLVDVLYRDVLRDSIAFMSRNSTEVASTTASMNVAKCLGRIAEHAKNIAEGTLFVVRGEEMPR